MVNNKIRSSQKTTCSLVVGMNVLLLSPNQDRSDHEDGVSRLL